MESKAAALRVGLFVTGGILALLALVFFLSGSGLNPGTPYESYFQESVQGLDVGTAVKFRGVNIGKVTDVGLVTAEYPPVDTALESRKAYRQVVVRFQVNPRKLGAVVTIDQAITNGLRVQLAPQGITGLAYLELTFVSPLEYPVNPVPWTPDTVVIPSIPSTLAQVQDAAVEFLSKLGKADLGNLADQVTQLVTTLNNEMTDGDARQALVNANTLLQTLNGQLLQADLPATVASLRNLAGGKQTTQLLTQLNQTTAQLNKASAELPALVAQSQAAVAQANETTADLQSQMLPILQDMKAATANLRDLTAQLQHNPGQVLLGAPPPPPEAQK